MYPSNSLALLFSGDIFLKAVRTLELRGPFKKFLELSYNNCKFPFLLMKSMLVLTLNTSSIDTVVFKLIN